MKRQRKRDKILTALFILTPLIILSSCGEQNERVISGSSAPNNFNLTGRSNEISISYDLPKYEISSTTIDGTVYSNIEIDSGLHTKKKGYAKLPYFSITVQVSDTKDYNLKFEDIDDYEEIVLETPLLPSRGTIYRNEKPDKIPYQINPSSISTKLYPEHIASISKPFILREVRGIRIFFYPFQYQSENKILRIYKNIKVRLMEKNTSSTTNPLNTSKNKKILATMDNIYSSLLANYPLEKNTVNKSILDEKGDLLVIYTKRDEEAIKPYINWKREKGFNVFTRVVARGTNVKSLIKKEYQRNSQLLYVQLVGDWEDIKSDRGPSNAPTDPMLGCVAGNDYFPDLFIGRFSAKNPEEVSIQVNKAIEYEKSPDLNGDWYSKALGIASDEGAGYGDDNEADFEHMEVIRKNKLLPYDYSPVFQAYRRPKTSSVASSINSGVGLINYIGHGTETRWVTSNYSKNDITTSTNGSKLPFIISVACVNGAFHNRFETFAESFLKKKNGGAVVSLMSTINQPWQPPMRGQDYMNDLIIGGYDYSKMPGKGISTKKGSRTVGAIVNNGLTLMYSESNNSEDLETIQTWTIFGDVSLELRTQKPKKIRLSNNTINMNQYFQTNVISGGEKIEGALVSISQGEKVYKAITDKNGYVFLSTASL